jgi:hypothetical protein
MVGRETVTAGLVYWKKENGPVGLSALNGRPRSGEKLQFDRAPNFQGTCYRWRRLDRGDRSFAA